LHASVVQSLLSLQLRAAPGTHDPPEHASPCVQNAPSSHGSELFECVHASVFSLHASVVQSLLSLQLRAAPGTHEPPEHVSPCVQNEPSSHGAELLACVQTSFASSQPSVVQSLLSLQSSGGPEQTPPLQVPAAVQN
jgi:hypothetical protein